MGTKAQLRAYLDAQDGHVGGAKYWDYVYGWSGGGLPFCVVGLSSAFKATNTECAYFPNKVAFDRRDKSIIGNSWVNRDNLEYLDAISFDWDGDGGGDHVGFFIEYLGGGKCRTFEFNVSNSCGYRTRNVSDIICGIRPKYKEEKKMLKTLPLLKKGDKGFAVGVLQRLLIMRGIATFTNPDEVFGDKTEASVKKFQELVGIYPDGMVGAKTWPALTAK